MVENTYNKKTYRYFQNIPYAANKLNEQAKQQNKNINV